MHLNGPNPKPKRRWSDAVSRPAGSPALLVAQLRDEDAALMLDCFCISDLLSSSFPLSLSLFLLSLSLSAATH